MTNALAFRTLFIFIKKKYPIVGHQAKMGKQLENFLEINIYSQKTDCNIKILNCGKTGKTKCIMYDIISLFKHS